MNLLNSVLVEGCVTAKPKASFTLDQTALCTFTIAYERVYKTADGKRTDTYFFDIEVVNILADACKTLEKGMFVRVVGRLKQDSWTDAEGKSQAQIIIVGEHIEKKALCKTNAENITV